jgi:heme/copper-type cytochrome/quinol oxidase subunit 1
VYHDTYYVVGHFHYVLSIAAAFACLLVLRMFAVSAMMTYGSQILGRLTIMSLLLGINWLFGTQHIVGIDGHPRRVFHSAEAHHIITEISNLSIPVLLLGPSMIVVCSLYTSSSNDITAGVSGLVIRHELVSSIVRSNTQVRITAVHEV